MPDVERQTFAESLERSLMDGGYLGRDLEARYAAAIKLARSLAAKMDDLEGNGWLNEANRPDTATPTQYLRALEVLGLVPPKRAASAAPEKPERERGRQRKSVSAFREKHLRVVG